MAIKIALCQMTVVQDKDQNLQKAETMIREAVSKGADIVALPEMFNCPYSNKFFPEFAESFPGKTVNKLSALAKELKVYIIGGSIPELDKDTIYNTSYSFDRSGQVIGRHRKVHLFDIDIEDNIKFKESDILGRGNDMTVIETEFGKIGVAICYDMRFPEMMRLMALAGANMIIVPAAFNMTTGPAHWDLTIRARALDNQVYYMAVSPARNLEASYHAYGYSAIASPWGEIIAQADEKETIVYGDIDLEYVKKIRQQLPLLKHRRTDVYRLEEKTDK